MSVLLLFLPLLVAQPAAAQPDSAVGAAVRATPEVSLLTMGPGKLVWERFGHAALQVTDPGLEPVCYNYGTFDFSKPVGLFVGILRAKPVFWVSRVPCARFLNSYMRNGRAVYSQKLPLSADKALALAKALEDNARVENKYYVYHHFYDNCSTRPRDHLNRALDGLLDKGESTPVGPSFREFGYIWLGDNLPLLFALDIFLGRGADARPDLFGASAIPDYLRELVVERAGVQATVVAPPPLPGQPEQTPPAVAAPAGLPSTDYPPYWHRWLVAIAVVLIPAGLSWLTGRASRAGIALSMFLPSLVGLLLWLLAIISTVPEFRYNEMLLIFLPLDFALPFLSARRQNLYARGRLGMLAGILLLRLVGVFHQPIWGAVLLVALPLLTLAFPLRRRSRTAQPAI